MIEWVGDMCRVWGRQKRRHLEGGFSYINEKGEEIRHVDGADRAALLPAMGALLGA